MGIAHLTPHGSPAAYRKQFISVLEYPDDEIKAEYELDTVIGCMCRKFSFEKVGRDTWVTDNEKLLAKTRHGAELRVKYHPYGSVYFMVVVPGRQEFHKENLAISHIHTYNKYLVDVLADVYGEVRRSTSRWTSTTVKGGA